MRLFLRKVEEKSLQLKEQFEMEEIDMRNTMLSPSLPLFLRSLMLTFVWLFSSKHSLEEDRIGLVGVLLSHKLHRRE